MKIRLAWIALLLAASWLRAADAAPDVQLTRFVDRVRVTIGGQLFTEYIFDGARRPYLYPVAMPDGTTLNREFPMKSPPGEAHDHPHHRSLWFAHGLVNGVDFWTDGRSTPDAAPAGTIAHEALLQVVSGAVGVIRATHRWLDADRELVCTDETTLTFRREGNDRLLDFEITLHAQPGEPLVLGDTKEGLMAFRVAPWLVLAPAGRPPTAGGGHLVTSRGVRDRAVWGTRAEWCDVHGPHDGRIYGVALFDHPANPRHPTWWMARDYGLLAANPFGQHDFEEAPGDPHRGDFTVPAGGQLTLRYRFVFHLGDEQTARLADRYRAFATEK